MSEKRYSKREDLSWPVSVWSPKHQRFFNGKSVNISTGGVCLSVGSMTYLIKVGEDIEINFPRTARLAEIKGGYSRIKTGTVVRSNEECIAIKFIES